MYNIHIQNIRIWRKKTNFSSYGIDLYGLLSHYLYSYSNHKYTIEKWRKAMSIYIYVKILYYIKIDTQNKKKIVNFELWIAYQNNNWYKYRKIEIMK